MKKRSLWAIAASIIECFRSVDYLYSILDFFPRLGQPHQNPGSAARIFPCNAQIACRPSHSILEKTIHEVLLRWDDIKANSQVFSAEDQLSYLTRKYHQEHQKGLALERKYQLLKKAFVVTFFLSSLGFYYYIWRKGKPICVKNGR